MIGVQNLRKGITFIDHDGNILKVLDYQHVKLGRGNAVVKVKVRNIRTGATLEKTFLTGGRVEDVRLDNRSVQYLYRDEDFYYFMDIETYEQSSLSGETLGEATKFLKEGIKVELATYNSEPIDIVLPTTVDLRVVETSPSFKGDTASGGGKPATLETGLVVQVPFFVNIDDTVRVDTRDASYVTRV